MATVCGGSLALFDAGVPMTAACAGVAMGLVKEGARVAVLTDILGTEDQLGDMDFKVAGTRQGVTSIQMDIKIEGLDFKIISEALDKARRARLHILDIMDQTIARPRSQLSKYAPRIITIQIRPDKIGDIIGPKGKVVPGIPEQTAAGLTVMETVGLDGQIFETPAPNGLVVLSERVPSVRSAAVGVWVRTASAHESAPTMGVSHLLEDMVFKGTERRTAQEIALALEARGGSLDAYTSRDTTAFQARVLDADLPRALDVLTDLVRHPLLRSSDLELERNVVLEEINTVEDTPDDLVFDLSARQLWPSHPYGYSILGTRESVSALATKNLKQLHERAYFPGNCVFAAAGNLTHEIEQPLVGEVAGGCEDAV